jgi:hypothetical protein
VTPLSRPRAPAATATAGGPPPRRVFLPWYALCIPLASAGCFYLGPLAYPEENVEPDILSYFPEEGTVISIGENGASVFVSASDEDPEDEVTFIWSDDVDGYIGTAIPFDGGSSLVLPYDERLDGGTLRCDVSDGHAGHTRTLEWDLEVL